MVDDIQWADDASAQFLHYLARQAASRPLLLACAYRDEELDSTSALARTRRRACGANRMRATCRSRGWAWPMPRRCSSARSSDAAHAGAGRAPASRDRRQPVLPDVDAARAAARRNHRTGVTGELPLPGGAARRRARARSRTCRAEARPTLDVAAVLGRRFDFETLLAVTREPEERLLRCAGGAGETPAAARGSRGRVLRFQPRQGARGGLPRDRRRAAHALHRAVGRSARAPRARASRTSATPRLAEHYERGHVVDEGAALPGARGGALAEALRHARCAALARSRRARSPRRTRSAGRAGRRSSTRARGAARAQAGQTEGAVADIRRVDRRGARARRARERRAMR